MENDTEQRQTPQTVPVLCYRYVVVLVVHYTRPTRLPSVQRLRFFHSRPRGAGHTGSRHIAEVKQRRARLVFAWVTTLEKVGDHLGKPGAVECRLEALPGTAKEVDGRWLPPSSETKPGVNSVVTHNKTQQIQQQTNKE